MLRIIPPVVVLMHGCEEGNGETISLLAGLGSCYAMSIFLECTRWTQLDFISMAMSFECDLGFVLCISWVSVGLGFHLEADVSWYSEFNLRF